MVPRRNVAFGTGRLGRTGGSEVFKYLDKCMGYVRTFLSFLPKLLLGEKVNLTLVHLVLLAATSLNHVEIAVAEH